MTTLDTISAVSQEQLTGEYTIDPAHSTIGFVARHAMITKVRGTFNEFEGRLRLDGDNPTNSSAEVVIQADSIDTRNADRDAHLRSNDFFSMDTYPEIRFTSTDIEQVDDVTYRVTGDLTLKGVTKPVTVTMEYTGATHDPWGNLRVGLEGSVTVKRRDWGLNWNAPLEAGGVLVSEKATLEFAVSAVKNG